MSFHVPHKHRMRTGYMASDDGIGNNGVFYIPGRTGRPPFLVVASNGCGWEQVSVRLPDRLPTWDEMCALKGVFWDDFDCVVQYHPLRADYVNNHSRCLRMWRPTEAQMPRPPAWMVGDAALGTLV